MSMELVFNPSSTVAMSDRACEILYYGQRFLALEPIRVTTYDFAGSVVKYTAQLFLTEAETEELIRELDSYPHTVREV